MSKLTTLANYEFVPTAIAAIIEEYHKKFLWMVELEDEWEHELYICFYRKEPGSKRNEFRTTVKIKRKFPQDYLSSIKEGKEAFALFLPRSIVNEYEIVSREMQKGLLNYGNPTPPPNRIVFQLSKNRWYKGYHEDIALAANRIHINPKEPTKN